MTAEQEIHVYSDSGTLTTGTHNDDIRNKDMGYWRLRSLSAIFQVTFW